MSHKNEIDAEDFSLLKSAGRCLKEKIQRKSRNVIYTGKPTDSDATSRSMKSQVPLNQFCFHVYCFVSIVFCIIKFKMIIMKGRYGSCLPGFSLIFRFRCVRLVSPSPCITLLKSPSLLSIILSAKHLSLTYLAS